MVRVSRLEITGLSGHGLFAADSISQSLIKGLTIFKVSLLACSHQQAGMPTPQWDNLFFGVP